MENHFRLPQTLPWTIALCLASFHVPSCAGEEATKPAVRTWTANGGKHTCDATFQSLVGKDVKLKRVDGKEITVPLDKLSEVDQQYVRKMAIATRPKKPDVEDLVMEIVKALGDHASRRVVVVLPEFVRIDDGKVFSKLFQELNKSIFAKVKAGEKLSDDEPITVVEIVRGQTPAQKPGPVMVVTLTVKKFAPSKQKHTFSPDSNANEIEYLTVHLEAEYELTKLGNGPPTTDLGKIVHVEANAKAYPSDMRRLVPADETDAAYIMALTAEDDQELPPGKVLIDRGKSVREMRIDAIAHAVVRILETE